jgi:hypothetical protein
MPCACVFLAYLALPILDGPPRTLSIEIDDWTNSSWGFYRIDRTRSRCTIAVARDGSRSNDCAGEGFRHYFLKKWRERAQTLYVRATNSAFRIDPVARTAYGGPCGCSWQPQKVETGADCAVTAVTILRAAVSPSGRSSIAGQAVHRYRTVDKHTGATTVVALSDASCEVMEKIVTYPGMLGIPAARWRYVVTSYIPGDPDPRWFTLPAGYRIEPKEPPGC